MKRYSNLKLKRAIRTRYKIGRNSPRLSVSRSNKNIYAQIIDDKTAKTLVASSVKSLEKQTEKGTKTETSRLIGKNIAEKAIKLGIKKVVFDRGGNKYHGRVKALAEGAREKGLEF